MVNKMRRLVSVEFLCGAFWATLTVTCILMFFYAKGIDQNNLILNNANSKYLYTKSLLLSRKYDKLPWNVRVGITRQDYVSSNLQNEEN